MAWNTLDELGKIYNMFVDFQESDSFWSSAESLSFAHLIYACGFTWSVASYYQKPDKDA